MKILHFYLLQFLFFCLCTHFANAAKISQPRIATDDEILQHSLWASPPGLPIDYSYNETTKPEDTHLGSVPGCPKSVDGVPWLYYGHPPRCFLAYSSGPCLGPSVLLPKAGNPYGICVCECYGILALAGKLIDLKNRYTSCVQKFSNKTMISDLQSEMCYVQGDQGPCEKNQVVSKHNKTNLVCLPICIGTNTNREYAQGLCEHEFQSGNGSQASEIAPTDCPEGLRFSDKLKKCTPLVMSPVG